MTADEIPKLADWLAEYRSRPTPTEVVVAAFDLCEPVPDDPSQGLAAGQVAVHIVRIEKRGWPGEPDPSRYVMGADASGRHLWDDWYESEEAARDAIATGHYGEVVERAHSG